jgi:hypothetical protein
MDYTQNVFLRDLEFKEQVEFFHRLKKAGLVT